VTRSGTISPRETAHATGLTRRAALRSGGALAAGGLLARRTAARPTATGAVAPAENWSLRRFDEANTGYNPNGTPLRSDVEAYHRLDVAAAPSSEYLLVDGTAFVHVDSGGLQAIDVETGEVDWVHDADAPAIPEFVEGDILAVRSLGQTATVLDRQSGAVKTELPTGPGVGMGYGGNGRWYAPRFDGTLVAGDASGSDPRWEQQLGGIGMRPAVSDGRVFVATIHDTEPEEVQFNNLEAMDAEGRLYALDATDGSIVWERSRERFGFGAPAVHDGTVYWTGRDGNVLAHDVETGNEQWRYTTDGSFHGSPAVTDEYLVAGNDDGRLYAIDPRSGGEIGTADADGRIRTAPVVVDDVVYFGSEGNTVYALEIGSGGILWEFDAGGPVQTLVAGDGRVLAGTPSQTYILGRSRDDGSTDGGSQDGGSADGTADAAESSVEDESGDESGQNRGFLTNDPDSSLAFLDDPVTLTWAGIGVSMVGIVMQLFGRQT
jgi:outer membrane protein assembly factor BamB